VKALVQETYFLLFVLLSMSGTTGETDLGAIGGKINKLEHYIAIPNSIKRS
jgi:hypothetical protein